MKSMTSYYLSRALLAILFSILFVSAGAPWWSGILAGIAAMAYFIWVPKSGRFTVKDEGGIAPLRRDERGQDINNKSARNALIISVLALACVSLYYSNVAQTDVPVHILDLIVLLAVASYFISDIWLRRR
jgi:hypothetical protein